MVRSPRGLKDLPRDAWGDGLGPHEAIDRIIQFVGVCGHCWGVAVYADERRALFYLV